MCNKSIKMLCIHQGFELYGSDRSFLSTMEAIKKELPHVYIKAIIPKSGPIVRELKKYVDEIIIEDVGSVTSAEAKKNPLRSLLKVIKHSILAKKRMDDAHVIYINTIVPFGYLIAGFFIFKPVIVHVREIPQKALAWIFSLWFRISRFHLLFNSKATKYAFGFSKTNKSTVIWNGVDPMLNDDSLFSPGNKIHLLIIGRINRWKGQKFFLDVLNTLSDEDKSKAEVYIVGDTPLKQTSYKDEIVEFVRNNNLERIVKILPFDENPEKYFRWADVVIVPSLQPEPFGRVAIEAMSASKAVIAARHGGLSEIVVHNQTGWLFEPGNKHDLKNILIETCNIKDEIVIYGQNAKQRYKENFTLEAYQKNFIDFLIKILPRNENV
jgi:glycosyltransferase involved in cell wall biosynthesis